jgi:hypothetical protein
MASLGRSVLIGFVVAGLLVAPAMAAPSAPLGMVLHAQSALLDKADVVGGASLYPGDNLETGSDGSAQLRIGPGQFYLLASSAATLSGTPAGVTAELARGTAGFASAAGQMIELRTSEAVIRPKNSEPVHAQVTILNSHQLIVSSYRGAVEVQVGEETHSIPENTSYRVDIVQDQNPGPIGVGTKSIHHTHALLVFLAFGALGGVTVWGIHLALESPDHP